MGAFGDIVENLKAVLTLKDGVERLEKATGALADELRDTTERVIRLEACDPCGLRDQLADLSQRLARFEGKLEVYAAVSRPALPPPKRR